MYSVEIDRKIEDKFPGTKIGIIFAENVIIKGENIELEDAKKAVIEEVRNTLKTTGDLYSHPNVISWEKFYREMGINPKKMPPAHVALVKRIIKKGEMPKINTVVDCCNLVAAKYLTPVGTFDRSKIEGKIYLRFSEEGENFLPLFSNEIEKIRKGEIVYADENKIFSRYSIDSDITKVTFETKELFCVVDGTNDIKPEYILDARNYLADLITQFCGGSTKLSYV